jgi:LacI family transcriptional regulator
MTVKMEEIAKACNVSRATVSYVLNDKPNSRISQKTKEDVLRTARNLNYKRQKVYKILPDKKIKIALVITCFSDYSESNHLFVFTDLMRGISDGFQNLGYNPEIQFFSFDLLGTDKTIQEIKDFKASGIIFLEAQNALAMLPEIKDIPYIVLYDSEAIGKPLYYLSIDDKKAAYMAVEHLITRGHRNIGLFSFSFRLECMKQRAAGYKSALEDHNIPFDKSLVKSSQQKNTDEVLKIMLRKGVTAIFTTSDLTAVLLMEKIKKEGLSVPEDISLMGFSDLSVASQVNPALTSIRKPRYEMGYATAGILTNWNAKNLIQKLWKPLLIVRKSTKEIPVVLNMGGKNA